MIEHKKMRGSNFNRSTLLCCIKKLLAFIKKKLGINLAPLILFFFFFVIFSFVVFKNNNFSFFSYEVDI